VSVEVREHVIAFASDSTREDTRVAQYGRRATSPFASGSKIVDDRRWVDARTAAEGKGTSVKRPTRTRPTWPKVLAFALVPLVTLGGLFAYTLDARVTDAKDAESDLDGLFSLSAVAAMEGALHEEGALAVPYTIGFVDNEEFDGLVAATDSARIDLQEEITYYEAGDPLGAALNSIEASLDGLDEHRAAIAAGDVDGSVVGPYRVSIDATTAAMVAIRERLVVPGMSPTALLAIDEARRASSDAVMAATGAALGQGEPATVGDALNRVDAAEAEFFETASSVRDDELDAALATDDAEAARAGVVAVATGEPFDLLAWGDVAAEWPLAYVGIETDAVETGLAVLETRATDAEAAAKTYALVGGIASLLAVMLTAAVTRSLAAVPRPVELGLAAPVPSEPAPV
jgi:hypothetical protein